MNRLTSDYGVIIKWSDYFIECYDYCPELLTFIDDTERGSGAYGSTGTK